MSRRYTDEFKAAVVRAVLDEYRSIEEISREFGVPAGTFGGWVAAERNLRRDRAARLKAEAEALPTAAAIKELRQENQIMTEAFSAIRGILVAAENALDKE